MELVLMTGKLLVKEELTVSSGEKYLFTRELPLDKGFDFDQLSYLDKVDYLVGKIEIASTEQNKGITAKIYPKGYKCIELPLNLSKSSFSDIMAYSLNGKESRQKLLKIIFNELKEK